MKQERFYQITSISAVLGGLAWVVKAGAIILTEVQPPAVFELGPALLAIALFGIYGRLEGGSRVMGKVGAALACLATLSWISIVIYGLIPNVRLPAEQEFIFPVSLFEIGLSGGTFIGLIVLGIATLRANVFSNRWRIVPLLIGLLPLPLALTSRLHMELPILLIGLSWMILGYFMSTAVLRPMVASTASNLCANLSRSPRERICSRVG